MCFWRENELIDSLVVQVELVHTQFRVSEDHKLRSMLKRQSAKVHNLGRVHDVHLLWFCIDVAASRFFLCAHMLALSSALHVTLSLSGCRKTQN